MRWWATNKQGFTIVELLIVIVVIGILAAITIVAFTGVQERAEVTKTTNAITAYKKALLLYKADKGTYPATGAMCLGDEYTPFSGQTAPSCRYSTSPIAVAGNSAARTLLREYMGGSQPMPSKKYVMHNTTEWVGGHFYGESYNYTLDGKPVVTIEYVTTASKCPVGPVYNASPPNFTSPAVERSAAFSSGGSRCYILLSNE